MTSRRVDSAGRAVGGSERGLRKRAFSLPELLVVVGIIGVLIAVLLPTLRKSVRQAAAAVCLHNLSQIGKAIELYKIDNGGWGPTSTTLEGRDIEGEPLSTWFQKLVPTYLNDPAVLTCPDDPLRPWLIANTSVAPYNSGASASSYGMNEFILASPGQFLCNLDRFHPYRPHGTLLVGDMGPDVIYGGGAGPLSAEGPNRSNGLLPWDDGYDPGDPDDHAPWLTARHLGGMNVLMIEGSVQRVATRALMTETIQPYYPTCAAGRCALCVDLTLPHYSFAASDTYWWTGSVPAP